MHKRQWQRYGILMPLLYTLSGRDPLRNRFEIEADLADGNYIPRGAREPSRASRRSARGQQTEALGRVYRSGGDARAVVR